jgi:hypothetical protein
MAGEVVVFPSAPLVSGTDTGNPGPVGKSSIAAFSRGRRLDAFLEVQAGTICSLHSQSPVVHVF